MTSTSASNHQHPSTSAGDFSGNPQTSTSGTDQNTHLATGGYAPSENQLAGLVEAATAAAGQEVSEWTAAAAVAAAAAGAAGNQHHLDGYAPDMHIDDDGFGDAGYGSGIGGGRQYRGPGSTSAEQSQPAGLTRAGTKKRKRNEDALDPALTASTTGLGGGQHQNQQSHQHQAQHSHHHHSNPYGDDSLEIRSTPPQSLGVGLHSAAALFRQPSSNKKYTRPPMSKLFSSLELSPENFLHLQAAAKSYMLDDRHPERRDCVGQRGKGDTEMVKLRLWNCVRHFLEVEGHGPRFFGEHVVNEGMGPRTYVWPRDQQKIISLVIPLLRRMVTNERQRQYAVETRKGGGTDERRRRKTEDSIQNFNASPSKYTAEDQHLQIQTQHPPPDDYSSAQTPLSAMQPHLGSTLPQTALGLTGLFLDGYTADWDGFSKLYDFYNNNYELDNLWSLSGLQLGDWRGLVAAVDSHYQIIHSGDYDCPSQCEDENICRILGSDATCDLRWRIGGNVDRPARNEFASSITRDVSRIIRDNLALKQGVHTDTQDQTPVSQHPPPLPPPNFSQSSESAATALTPTSPNTPLTLQINIIQNGKRVLPRLDILAGQCPDISAAKQLICRRFAGQIPSIPADANLDADTWSSTAEWKVNVWLPDGLTPIQSDGEWTIALLSAEKVDWMDGDLKVLVELESTS